jgi:hypothetical protein
MFCPTCASAGGMERGSHRWQAFFLLATCGRNAVQPDTARRRADLTVKCEAQNAGKASRAAQNLKKS